MSDELTFSRFEEAVRNHPDKTALIFLGERFTFQRLNALTENFAAGLHGLGVGLGDRVMIYLTNSVQLVIAYLAVQKLGAAAVMVSPIYTSAEIEYMLTDSGAKTIICHDTNIGYVKEVFAKTQLKTVIVTRLLDLMPWYKRGVAFLFDKAPVGKVEKGPEVRFFRDLLKTPPGRPEVRIDPIKDLSYILYTGGTTGFPKGVPGNHWGQVSYVNDITDDVLSGHVKPGEDTYIAVNPLFHIMALGFFLALGLNLGNTTVLMPVPHIDAMLKAIERCGARWMLGVPALYRMILENDRFEMYDLSSIRYCYCGGDVLPREVLKRWNEKVGVPIYQVYGSTEAGHVSYSRIDQGEPSPMSIGRPLASRQCLILEPESMTPAQPGDQGELLVTSEHTIKEYLNKPRETAASYVSYQGQTFYRTSDVVYQAEDGQIYYVERAADILKYKGYRVSASEVEAALQDHEAVIGACVVGVPDPKVGERVKAIVVLKEDAKGVAGTDLIKFCRGRLAPYKVPSYIEFRDMLPKSKVGKLLRREIRDEERRRLEQD